MNLITLEKLSKSYGDRLLLDEVDLLVNQGDRIGLIGVNGSGKSTLLRIIAGLDDADSGQLVIWGGVRLRYVDQQPQLKGSLTVIDQLFQSDTPQMRLLLDYRRVSQELASDPHSEALQQRLIELSDAMDRAKNWNAEVEAKLILSQLGIMDTQALVGTLSGGQRKRVALAQALLDPVDLLILDEPTNHIDADTIAWLEDRLVTTPQALLMVTHDRYFLERVVNRIVELDRRKLMNYPGNYRRYLELRTRRQEQLATKEVKRQQLLRRELEWLRRGAMARSTKQKARRQRITELQRLDYDRGAQRVSMALAGRRLGKRVLEAEHLAKSYGPLALFADLDFQLAPGDRIGIVGPNGTGKSTFLDILAGRKDPDIGEVKWGETVHLGYYDQEAMELAPHGQKRVIEYIQSVAPLIRSDDGRRIEAAQMLEWFLFTRPQQQARISSLSGGERRRLYLLRTLIHQPNVLFLDEPTNDLDVQTLNVLEEFLDHFKGCLLVVSHDRYFLDRNVDFLMSFESGVVGVRFPTPYASYRSTRDNQPPGQDVPKMRSSQRIDRPTPTSSSSRRVLTYQEKREVKALEAKISDLELEQTRLAQSINETAGAYQELRALTAQLEAVQLELEGVFARWVELAEIDGGS